jgi:phenylpyruvate tautomerase PptA (4-oxalocrotonate tautomerase family)
MPLIKRELAKGKSNKYLSELKATVMDCVAEVLKLPADDRNIRLVEYEKDRFSMKPPYTFLIEVTLFSGRSKETKRTLYRKIVDTLYGNMGIPKDSVFIVLNEQPLENWGIRGGVPADEVKLDFKVNI